MKIKLVLTVFLSIFFISGCGIGTRYKILKIPQEDIKIEEPISRLKVGERLTYKAEWLGIDVGIATLSIEEIITLRDRKVYRIVTTAETTPLISKLYRVEDKITTYLDVENLYPLRFEKKQREGGYRAWECVDFDHKEGKALYVSKLNDSSKEYDIPKGVHDPLSSIYYFRLQDVSVGKSIFIDVNLDEKNWHLEAKVHTKGVVDIENLGEWDAFMVEPLPWFHGKIRRKAKMSVWFSADEKRIPLLVITRGIPFVGTVKITLQNIE